jgi:hypothetical protein
MLQTNDVTCTAFKEERNLRLDRCMCIVTSAVTDETLNPEVHYVYGWNHGHGHYITCAST